VNKIQKTSEALRHALLRGSAQALPDSPSAAGMSADEIRRSLWSPMLASENSLLSEQGRIVDEANAALEELDSRVSENEKMVGSLKEAISAAEASAGAAAASAKEAENSAKEASHASDAAIAARDGSFAYCKDAQAAAREAVDAQSKSIKKENELVYAIADCLGIETTKEEERESMVSIVTLPTNPLLEARLLRLYGKCSLLTDDSGYLSVKLEYPTKIVRSEEDGSVRTLVTIDPALFDGLAHFGLYPFENTDSEYENYLFWEAGKMYYHQGCRYHVGWLDLSLSEGEKVIEQVYDEGYIVALKEPVVTEVITDIESPLKNADGTSFDGILNAHGASSLKVEHGDIRVKLTVYEIDTNGKSLEKLVTEEVEQRLLNDARLSLLQTRVGIHDWDITDMKQQLGISTSDFGVMEGANERVVVPYGSQRYAKIAELRGAAALYSAWEYYSTYLPNYPARIVSDTGRVLFELPGDVMSRLAEFGLDGNYVYFEDGKAYYKQTSKAVNEYEYEIAEGESLGEYLSNEGMRLVYLAEAVVSDISDYIISDGLIDVEGCQYITVEPRYTEEYVYALDEQNNGQSGVAWTMPSTKFIFEI